MSNERTDNKRFHPIAFLFVLCGILTACLFECTYGFQEEGGFNPEFQSEQALSLAPSDYALKLRFENNLFDDSINSNNGNLHGANPPVFTDGRNDKCLSFNGQDDSYATFPSSNSLNFGTGDFTVALWIKTTTGDCDFIQKFNGSAGYCMDLNSGVPSLWVKDANNVIGEFCPATQVYPDGTFRPPFVNNGLWHHIAVTVDRDNPDGVIFYIDGIRIPFTVPDTYHTRITQVNASLSNTLPLYLGCHHFQYGWDYAGLMDDMIMINRSITAAEVAELYNQPGLRAMWQFEGNANDFTGKNNGTVNGTASYAAGVIGQAFSFNSGNYISIPGYANFNNMQAFTLEACIYPTAFNTYNAIISKVNPNRDFVLQLYNGRINAHFAINFDQYTHCFSDNQVPLNAWSHIAAVWTGNRWQLYLNGVLIKESAVTTAAPQWTGTRLGIGTMNWSYGFLGKIDEAKIFDRALSAAQLYADWALDAAMINP